MGTAGAFAITAGVAATVQIAVLSRLGERIGALEAGAIAWLVTAIGGAVVLLVAGRGLGAYREAFHVPWWMVAGGLTGNVIVASIIVATPRLGVVTMTVLILVGQFASAAVADRYGLFGLERIAMSPTRWLGLGLVVAGALLTLRR
ncbi:MAG: DMT family transporter [Thermoleophilia bacterium]|nr:DMT family transporter [Thermoleophilia bacterium]